MKQIHRFFLIPAITFVALSNLTACSTWNPYRPVIHQGNIVTPDNIARLTQGMSKVQVQAILGTPITQDIFQAQRWDYVYYADKSGKTLVIHRLTLWFEGDQLNRWESEGLPATIPSTTNPPLPVGPASSEIDTTTPVVTTPVKEK